MRVWFVIVALAGVVLFLSIMLADREQRDAVDRLSNYQFPHSSETENGADPKDVSERSPYMRNERY